MLRDIRQSARRLLRRPGLTGTAVAMLALAIGANTAIFSLLDTVALRPLPYQDADRLVLIGSAVPGLPGLRPISWPRFQMLAARSGGTVDVTAYYEASFGLTEKDRPEELTGVRVTGSFFAVWGVRPILGRTFTAEEEKADGGAVVLLSESFWRKRFGGDRGIVGKRVDIDGLPTTVIGVLPDVLRFPFKEDQIWLPRPDSVTFMNRATQEKGVGYLQVVGRLRPGVSPAAMRRDLLRISASYREIFPDRLDTVFPLTAQALDDHLIGSARGNLLMLLAGVGLVLLIACADVANLLLADGLARRREIAVAVALGAGRRRIFAQAVRESVLLAAAGGALGVLLAAGGLRLLVAAQSAGQSADLPRLDDVALSSRALAFAVLVTAVSGLLAGLAPAWQTLRTDPKSFLSAGEPGAAGGRRSGWAQGLLVTVQVALALVLLAASGLLLRSLHRVNGVPLGFDPAGLQFVEITLPEAKYPSAAARRACFEQLVDRVRQIPGVQSAALVDRAPTTNASHFRMHVEGGPPVPPEKQPLVLLTFAGDGYFTTLHARLLAGHDFDPGISASAPLSAIVNRSFRDRYFSGRSPLGRRLELSGVPAAVEIIGVVEDIQQTAMESGPEPMVFLFRHQPGSEGAPSSGTNLAIRTGMPPATLAASLRRAVNAVDPGQPVAEITSMGDLLAAATARRRLTAGLFSGFSALALVLCLLGLYGMVSHSIFLRRREIGIRIALGAGRGQVLGSLLGLCARWIVPGLLLGLIGSWFAGRALGDQLFQVEGTGLVYHLTCAAALAVFSFWACLLPLHKATEIDPAMELRVP